MARRTGTTPAPARLESIKHMDKRANIPTEELRDFVADDEAAPKTMLYPRDASLDPQLVWQGKDEQDRADLAVPVVPIYIQEKIHPQAIIDDLLAHAARPGGGDRIGDSAVPQYGFEQIDLFADFNGGPHDFAQKVEFYEHEQNWTNRMILGDSLLVMTSLAEKEGLKGKVQTIYLDPPYGIKFGSNWQVSTRKRDVKDGKAEDATRQPEQVRAFRDTWKLGIHSYLAYLRDRLAVARELLTETGSVFVQIGDENVHLVRCVLDEVFGADNSISLITFRKTGGEGSTFIGTTCDFLLWYGKDRSRTKYRQIYKEKRPGDEGAAEYNNLEFPDGSIRRMTEGELKDPNLIPSEARVFATWPVVSPGYSEINSLPIQVDYQGKTLTLRCPSNRHWSVGVEGTRKLWERGRLLPREGQRIFKRYITDFSHTPVSNQWTDSRGELGSVYVVQTSTVIVERCLLMTTDPGDLVLDPTCGSGTTAYVAEQWGRRWITCDTSRVALALARTRLMAAKYPYYLLADSPEGVAQSAGLRSVAQSAGLGFHSHNPADCATGPTGGDIRKGFVYKRVPHVTLKSIANNPDIREGMTRAEIDAAIARHADTETLFDQPYEDNKRVRVCGPFSVESLSPHRVLSTADENQDGTVSEQEARKQQDFATMILENLCKAGVQNTKKSERLKFDRLDPYAGTWIQFAGEAQPAAQPAVAQSAGLRGGNDPQSGGLRYRVAVSLGPEHGTVGPQQVKEAAKEAVQGVGFDLLIVCGFAFDPHVSEEAKRYGKLNVLTARMNPDLAMGDELLKKTGAGNLFMVFGEPDVEVRRVGGSQPGAAVPQAMSKSSQPGATVPQVKGKKPLAGAPVVAQQIQVVVKGVDVYDPTTGEIRSSSTDDIACWFIDTDYNGESFFVRHAYFTGAEEPYEKLKRALRAEIDEAAWAMLYSTESRPFDAPASGKIAVKVINHYGDEVLRVLAIA